MIVFRVAWRILVLAGESLVVCVLAISAALVVLTLASVVWDRFEPWLHRNRPIPLRPTGREEWLRRQSELAQRDAEIEWFETALRMPARRPGGAA